MIDNKRLETFARKIRLIDLSLDTYDDLTNIAQEIATIAPELSSTPPTMLARAWLAWGNQVFRNTCSLCEPTPRLVAQFVKFFSS